ncbi:MAG TPA: methyltransferase domain-containing protein [Bryobacteraceae bacterium]|nr:methyltransferase domain-containing protein [Bryobacteraceae bacterium]
MAEFTGERVIPGEVDIDLLNEHMARYTFAARLARGKRVLDAGCGAGYGSVELGRAAERVVGVDRAADAIEFARANYAAHNVTFEEASCEALPHADASFELVVAFEVIEHLQDWRGFLREAHRVLVPNGQLVVSTPNKLYYTESRGADGANPFHVHEFDFEEFRAELKAVYPHVSLFLENHVEGFTFQPHEAGSTSEVRVDAGESAPDESHFFVAVCANRPQIGNPTYVYIPRAANVLRERERHIRLLQGELADKDGWLADAQRDLAEMTRRYASVESQLEESNRWAGELKAQLQERWARVDQLQAELAEEQERARQTAAAYDAKIAGLEQDIQSKVKWARDVEAALTADIQKQTIELVKAVDALHQTEDVLRNSEKELQERTEWALRLDKESAELARQLALYRASRWVKLGRKVGLGPAMPAS